MKKKNLILVALFFVLAFSLTGCWDQGYVLKQTIEGDLIATPAGRAEIDIFSRNGAITVKPVDGNKFKVEMEMRVRTITRSDAEKAVEESVVVDNRTGFLRVGVDDSRISARIIAEIPRDLYYDISARTSNGGISLEELELGDARLRASNGGLTLTNIKFDYLNGLTSNGSLRGESFYGDTLRIETSNGSVNLKGTARVFDIRTSNSRIEMEPEFISDRPELSARTSNGSIVLKLKQERNIGFEISGRTSNGTFRYDDLSNITTLREGLIQSRNFSSMSRQVKIDLNTSNGNIDVGDR